MRTERDDLLGYIGQIKEFEFLGEFMDDEQVDIAVGNMIKLIGKPDVQPQYINPLLAQLSSCAGLMQIKSKLYKTVWKTQPDARAKYELYHSAYSALNEVVASLKYQAKVVNLHG